MKVIVSTGEIVVFLTLSLQISNIIAIACNQYNITSIQQNDTITINFPSNNLLKLNRTIRCTSTSSLEIINGCFYRCLGLEYGQHDEIMVGMQHDNGTVETCFIEYTIPLHSPVLAFFNLPGDRVQLGVIRPLGSFDYVNVQCSDQQSHIIFNTSISFNTSIVTVECSLVSDLPLMSFVLETIKKDFNSTINRIDHEVPLPVPFNSFLSSLLLTVNASAPPLINLNSTYEFHLIFYDKNDESISYERGKVLNLMPHLGITLNYGLIPNARHRIIFTHVINPMIYTHSISTILPISNVSYPFEVTNVRLQEQFHNILISWDDPHSFYDPIEFIILCNSSEQIMKNVGRNTSYICEQMTFNETTMVSVETRVAIPGYIHDRTAIVRVHAEEIPQIPAWEVFNRTETSIAIRWKHDTNSLVTNSFEYRIKCGINHNSTVIDIRSNEYQCQSLEEGTLYIITMLVINTNKTIQRIQSIQNNTLLQKCQYKNHFYSVDSNGIHSIIIEWIPPNKNFDKIYVQCPSGQITFEYEQVMSFMYVKCVVTRGLKFNVTFATYKSGYELAVFQFTDISPIDLSTIMPTSMLSPMTQSSTASIATSNLSTTERLPTAITNCSQDVILTTTVDFSRWRTAAIIAFVLLGFFIISTICLIIFSVLLYLRNR